MKKRIAMLATGEEIIIGDIQDTNATYFAQQLTENNIQAGRRAIVGDDPIEIEDAIRYLLPNHDALITIGGLGPTSDDKTREALAAALNLPLEFFSDAWQWLEELYLRKALIKNVSEIPETNRQQAFFPKGATAIQNHNGTAAACHIRHEGKDIFMLPGPPNECRPIFNEIVVPLLLKNNYSQKIYRASWLLLGVSESSIAEQLETIEKPAECQLGYRVHYPYLEIKLWCHNENLLKETAKKFEPILKPKTVSHHKKTASEQLLDFLIKNPIPISIEDHVTGGCLQTQLLVPKTFSHVFFHHNSNAKIKIQLTGLDLYWQTLPQEKISIPFTIKIDSIEIKKEILYRGPLTLVNATEIICWEILKFFI